MEPLVRPDEMARVHERVREAVDGGSQCVVLIKKLTCNAIYRVPGLRKGTPMCKKYG